MDYAAVASDAGSLVPVYDIVHTPLRIYNARGTAWNHHLRWEAARVKAQDVQDILVVPLVGGAISIAATGLASAGATAVAAAGLGGGSLEAGYSYAHPDQDAATDQVAVTELLCIVDLTEPLLSMSVVQLALDKAALRDAVDKMTIDAADVLASDDPKDQAVKASVTQAKTLAESKIAALNTELSAYVSLPSVIRSATDAADNKAKDGGKRSFDYAGVLADLQKAASTQARRWLPRHRPRQPRHRVRHRHRRQRRLPR